MKSSWMFLALSLLTAGCPYYHEDPNLDGGTVCTPSGMMCPAMPDMLAAQPKCAAAKGLSGDNLLCVDFDKVTQLSDPALTGWKFDANMAGCWQKFFLKASALNVVGGRQGWQIQSIAVMGS